MTWTLILVLAAGAYGFKVLGLVVIGDRALPAALERCLLLIPAALISAIVVLNTFSSGQQLSIEPRVAGVAAAVVAAWRKAPVIAIIIIGATVSALVRLA